MDTAAKSTPLQPLLAVDDEPPLPPHRLRCPPPAMTSRWQLLVEAGTVQADEDAPAADAAAAEDDDELLPWSAATRTDRGRSLVAQSTSLWRDPTRRRFT